MMDHDKPMGTAAFSAEAESAAVPIALREYGIICGVPDIAVADAPLRSGADCPSARLSSARQMFNGRVGAGVRDDFLPRQDFTSIPPKPPPCPGKGEKDMARQTNRFDEVRRQVAGVDLLLHEEDGKRFVVVEVKAGSETPYYTFVKGHRDAFIRIGNESVRADAIQLKRLVLKGSHLSWDGLPSRWRLSDFSFEVLRATYFEKRRKSFENSDFASFDLVGEDGMLSNAGALLADRSPVRHSRVFCTRWKGLTKAHGLMEALADREFSGGLISLFRNTMEFIESNTKMMWRKTDDGRMNYPEYPERAYEEGLVNALIHRDYLELGSEVHVDIYDDRMEITSPGGMPSGHCVQELDARQVTSKRRNPVIADLFQRLDLMERRGSGFKKILDAYAFESEKRGETVVPRLESTQTDFFLILPNLNYGRKINGVESSSEHFEHDTVNGIVNGTANGIVDGTEKIISTVVSTADRIIEAIRTNGQITYDGLAEVVGMSRRTISREIKALLSKGVIRRVGPDKTGHWEVVK